MSSDLPKKVAKLFHGALQIDPANRREYLHLKCGNNQELFDEVDILLKGDEAAESIFGSIADEAINLIHFHDILSKNVGRYQILERIGSGGMGEVYLAEDHELDRQVAIKLLPALYADDEKARERFTREGQATARLDHPNVVTVYEVGEYKGVPYIVMEYIRGHPLQHYRGKNRMSVNRIEEVAIPLCEGLAAAHTAGVIHRDIKPSNIIIDTNGQPRILDFGLATFIDSATLTRTGSTMGTFAYMAPEQIEGRKSDVRSDLFSLGVVLYELLTGSTPFKRDNIAATMQAVLKEPVDESLFSKCGSPDYLKQVILKLLKKEPDRRYQSTIELLNDLREKEVPKLDSGQESTLANQTFEGVRSKGSSDINADAQDFYSKAQGYFDNTREGLLNAQTMVERAIDLAPNYAQAHAFLGRVLLLQRWHYYEPDGSRLESAKASIDRALALEPKLPEAHTALGYYHFHGRKQYEDALVEFRKVIRLQPNNTDCFRAIASIQSRQGKWVESEASYRRLIELDPRNVDALMSFGLLLTAVRRFSDALDVINSGIDLAPDQGRFYQAKVWVYICWNGDMGAARQVLEESEKTAGKWSELTRLHTQLDLIEGRYQHALNRMTDPPGLESPVSHEVMFFYTLKADVHRFLGQADQVRQCLETIITPAKEYCELAPDDPTPHLFLGKIYAGLGRPEDAIRETKLAIELYPVEDDQINGFFYEVELVDIYTILGEYELAIDQIERILSMTSCWTPIYFRIWPVYIPLRSNKRFKMLTKSVKITNGLPSENQHLKTTINKNMTNVPAVFSHKQFKRFITFAVIIVGAIVASMVLIGMLKQQRDFDKIYSVLERSATIKKSPFVLDNDWPRLSLILLDEVCDEPLGELAQHVYKTHNMQLLDYHEYNLLDKAVVGVTWEFPDVFDYENVKDYPLGNCVIDLYLETDNKPQKLFLTFARPIGFMPGRCKIPLKQFLPELSEGREEIIISSVFNFYPNSLLGSPYEEQHLNRHNVVVSAWGDSLVSHLSIDQHSITVLDNLTLDSAKSIFTHKVSDTIDLLLFDNYPVGFPRGVSSEQLTNKYLEWLNIDTMYLDRSQTETESSYILSFVAGESGADIPLAARFELYDSSLSTAFFIGVIFGSPPEIKMIHGKFRANRSRPLKGDPPKKLYELMLDSLVLRGRTFEELLAIEQLNVVLKLVPSIDVAREYLNDFEFWSDTTTVELLLKVTDDFSREEQR